MPGLDWSTSVASAGRASGSLRVVGPGRVALAAIKVAARATPTASALTRWLERTRDTEGSEAALARRRDAALWGPAPAIPTGTCTERWRVQWSGDDRSPSARP